MLATDRGLWKKMLRYQSHTGSSAPEIAVKGHRHFQDGLVKMVSSSTKHTVVSIQDGLVKLWGKMVSSSTKYTVVCMSAEPCILQQLLIENRNQD
jgi:hypothetical protein